MRINSLLLILLMIIISSCSLGRKMFWNAPGLKDYKRFDYAEVKTGSDVFHFKEPNTTSKFGSKIKLVAGFMSLESESLDDYLVNSNALAFLIIRNDSILYERYFKGTKPDDRLTSFSVAKTFTGTLVGIAIEEGFINSEEDLVSSYLPELKSPEFSNLKIKHLLNHTSGLDLGTEGDWYYGLNMEKLLKRIKPIHEPGEIFHYMSGNSQLLGIILERVTKISLGDYLSEKIWSKIGTENDIHWSTDKGSDGLPKAFCCLNGTARDYARFGRLWLNGGNWNGTQLIPEDWVYSTLHPDTDEGAYVRYKNQVWIEDCDVPVYAAAGLYGQYIYMHPGKNLMIIKFSKPSFSYHPHWNQVFRVIMDQL